MKALHHRFLSKAFMVALVGLFAGFARAAEPHTLHIVSVGITNAQGQSPLKATKKDALDMVQWAEAQQGKLFAAVRAKPLTNEQATRNNILQTLNGLRGQVQTGDYTILYMSAHGGKNRQTGEYGFCAFDGSLPWNAITTALRNLPGTKIVILDTCQAGAIFRSDNLIVFSACLANQSSKDGSSPTGNSLFTLYLLEALQGKADLNRNGVVSLTEAAAYVSGKLEAHAPGQDLVNQQTSTLYRPVNVPDALPLARLTARVRPVAAEAAPLAGTTWTGREAQGALSLLFKHDGKVVMIDDVTPNPVNGTWSQQGNQVTITFNNCVYRGTIQGTTLAGQGVMAGSAWNFSVSRN